MKQYKKLNCKQILVLTWVGLSFYGIMLVAEAPFWLLGSVIGSFGLSVYVANRMDWKGTEFEDEDEEV